MINIGRRRKKPQYCFFPEHRRNNGHPDIKVNPLYADAEMSVLRNTTLCNIKVAEYLNSCNKRIVYILLKRHKISDNTV